MISEHVIDIHSAAAHLISTPVKCDAISQDHYRFYHPHSADLTFTMISINWDKSLMICMPLCATLIYQNDLVGSWIVSHRE